MKGHGRSRDGGFALIAVMAVALALAMIAGRVTVAGRTTLSLADAAIARAEARAAADAAIWGGHLRLGRSDLPVPEGVSVDLSASPAAAAVDLNRADRAALAAVAARAGVEDAGAFAAAVVGRRAAFAARGLSWQIEPAAFNSVDEARGLVPAASWPALRPHLTVHGTEEGAARYLAEARHVRGATVRVEALLIPDPSGGDRIVYWRELPAAARGTPR